MKRPVKFENHRYLGDKRNQFAYDLDAAEDSELAEIVIEELMGSEFFLCFSPDVDSEVRNRGYTIVPL